MDKTPNYIKKTLTEAKTELLKNEKLRVSREAYVQKLKEIFTDKVIELNEGIESKMSSTGTGTSEVISQSIDTSSKVNISKRNTQKDNKIIFLNNEVIQNNLNEIDEANNELLLDTNDDVIELKDEITDNEKIIQLSEEVHDEILLSDEIIENQPIDLDDEILNEQKNIPIEENLTVSKSAEFKEGDSQKFETLNEKINDLDINSSELSEKLDELLDQKNLFSEKFNDELDIKLTEALNRSEDNLENKLNNINNTYHEEFSKYENETNKNFANLEDQIGQLNDQFIGIQNNINSISNKLDAELNPENQTEQKAEELKDFNIKIENALNNIDNKIVETLDKISEHKTQINERIDNIKNITDEKISNLSETIKNIEPEVIKTLEEKQKNKSESEKLQDKFDQLSKIMDMQNMRMLQMYHSAELQHSHSILKDNLKSKAKASSDNENPEFIFESIKKELFPKIRKEMDLQFDILREQMSEFEIKSILDKVNTKDISKEFKKPTKKFTNLFDAKKYIKNNISKKYRDWIKNNDSAIDEIAKKLLLEK